MKLLIFQSVVCDDLDIPKYSMFSVSTKKDLKIKDRADLLEAFIGALYVDKDLVIFLFNLLSFSLSLSLIFFSQ